MADLFICFFWDLCVSGISIISQLMQRPHAPQRADMKKAYRTEIPDRLVYILAAMFMDANSWKSSLAA